MPDPITHYVFGEQVLSDLPSEIGDMIDVSIFERALQGPDPWSTLGFWGGWTKRYAVRSGIMHKTHTGAFLRGLLREATGESAVPVFSYLAGFLCHYCLDKNAHPYIICKGGVYDGTPETYSQRGGHVRLERAIDSFFARRVYRCPPWCFPFVDRVFKHRRLPESLRLPLERVFERVYDWEDAFDLLNRAMRCERLFYTLMRDRFGLVQWLLRPLSHGANNYCLYSYYRRDIDPTVLDYMNDKNDTWYHPFAPSIAYTDSFFELFERSKKQAAAMIAQAYACAFDGREVDGALFGDDNYSTGLPCDDIRNENQPVCEPLIYKNYYQNG